MSTVTFYKLKHSTDITKECYVGCTKNMICRKSVHKYDCNTPNKKKYNFKVYRYIRANDGFDNWCFEVLEQKEGLSKRDRHIREGMLIVQHNATLNVQDPAATVNGTSISQKNANRKFYYANKENRAEYRKCYQDTVNTCVKCGRTYRGNNKKQHQRSRRCQRITQQRIQPVINIDGDNNTVTVNVVTV